MEDELDVEVCLGEPVRGGESPVLGSASWVERVRLANPHTVVGSSDLGGDDFASLGDRLDRATPGGSNVEFVARVESNGGASTIRMRVWERGVGETLSCGTGSAAAACVASERFALAWPIRVHQRGGTLRVDRDADGRLWLAGPVTPATPV